MTEFIKNDSGELLAILFKKSEPEAGLKFYTPHDANLQVARMFHPAGHKVESHVHKPLARTTYGTAEILFVNSGSIVAHIGAVDRIMDGGDCILFLQGAHGISVLVDADIWEFKQGPYLGKAEDKEPAPLWEGGPHY